MNSDIFKQVWELLHYGFVQRALIAGVFVAICCSVLGIFLVLRRYSMLGDGLSHVAVGMVGFALVMGWSPIYFAIPGVTLSSLAIPWLTERTKAYGDAAIAMLSGVGLAVGVMFVSFAGGSKTAIRDYLFGNILTISPGEVIISSILSLLVIAVVLFFFHDLFACTFEPEHAKVLGIKTVWVDRILLLVSGLTVVLAVRIVGAMLVTSLIVFPAILALQVAQGFRNVILTSVAIGVASVVIGILISCFLDRCPSGPVIVLVNLGFFVIGYGYSLVRR